MADGLIALVAIALPMSIPIIAIVTSHQRKMAEIRARSSDPSSSTLNELRLQLSAVREEITTLRDTSTRFDMSFDAALSRLESRVDRVEDARAVIADGTLPASAGADPVSVAYPRAAHEPEESRVLLGQKG